MRAASLQLARTTRGSHTARALLARRDYGRDPFNQNSDRSNREKRTTSKGGPVFSKLFRLDRTDPLSFGPKFPEILVEWIAPYKLTLLGNPRLASQGIIHTIKFTNHDWHKLVKV